jgi:hypothetical protein
MQYTDYRINSGLNDWNLALYIYVSGLSIYIIELTIPFSRNVHNYKSYISEIQNSPYLSGIQYINLLFCNSISNISLHVTDKLSYFSVGYHLITELCLITLEYPINLRNTMYILKRIPICLQNNWDTSEYSIPFSQIIVPFLRYSFIISEMWLYFQEITPIPRNPNTF